MDVSLPGRFATKTFRHQNGSPPGRFAPWTIRPLDASPPGRFAHMRQTIRPPNSSTQFQTLFLWVRHTCTEVDQSINNDLGLHCHRQKYVSYLTTANRLVGETSKGRIVLVAKRLGGEPSRGQNVHDWGRNVPGAKRQSGETSCRRLTVCSLVWYDQVAGCGGPKPTTTTC